MHISWGRILALTLLVLMQAGTLSAQMTNNSGWTLVTDKDNILVYTRRSSDSSVKEVKVHFEVKASLQVFKQFLDYAPAYTQWVYKCSESRRLRTVNRDEFYYYVRTDFPFPVSDRDLVVHARNWVDARTGIAYAHSVAAPREVPAKDDCVRITHFESHWTIKPINNTELAVTYEVKTSPGGSIPDWVTNLGITTGPTRTMQALRAAVERKMTNTP